ncbi:Pkinase-domain-containing protein [Microthyrium microscopicum]|uniref:Pkinase-domain-containing protein n=1 Tax=Microthyrium microscopicum TaxID=703497 RepID=A0A6A6UBN0_9PEZI|nr:Pkinase-domain-containing protein [Microthyrium microscopicum]
MATASSSSTAVPLRRKYSGCSDLKAYSILRKLGEGTFGEVYQGHRKETGEVVALKKILMHNEREGFPITALRELKLLKTLAHSNVIKLEEMAVERTRELKKHAILYMVTPYMEHDLSGLLDNPNIRVTEPMRKCYMLQLFQGLNYLHQNHILHRDMKAANLLISNIGILKIADFGLARHYEGPTPKRGKGGGEATRDYTSLVVTRWYRPPELLLQLRRYTTAIDMWGAGCVFGEMFKRKPILQGQSDLHQAQIVFELVGSPNEQNMPGWERLHGAGPIKNFVSSSGNMNQYFREVDSHGLDLLKELFKLDWRKRINAIDAMDHPYFKSHPLPCRPEDIPTFEDSHELDRRNKKGEKPALPPAPMGGTVGGGGANGDWPGDHSTQGHGHQQQWGNDRGPPGAHRDNRQGSRVPAGAHGRDHHGNGSRGHDRDQRRPPPGAARPSAWQTENRPPPQNGAEDPSRGSTLPPPPGENSRHPLPLNPHRKKDTYVPAYDDGRRRDDARREDRPSRTPDRYNDRREGDRRDNRRDDNRRDDNRRDDRRYRDDRRRDEYRDPDRPRAGDDRYRDRGDRRDRARSGSPDSRDRGNNRYSRDR